MIGKQQNGVLKSNMLRIKFENLKNMAYWRTGEFGQLSMICFNSSSEKESEIVAGREILWK